MNATLAHGSYGWTKRNGTTLDGERRWISVDAPVTILGESKKQGRALVQYDGAETLFAWVYMDELENRGPRGSMCPKCGSVLSAVTFTCVRGSYCR